MMNIRSASSKILIRPVLILTLTLIVSLMFATSALAVIANAGVDQILNEGELVILDGSNSTGTSLSFVWSENNLILGTDESFSKVLTAGIHTITLNVTDNANNIATDSVKIIVNDLPNANAGNDKTVTKDDTVTFDASYSTDTVGGIVSYEWREEGTILSTSKIFSKIYTDGIHTITLKVIDRYGRYDSDEIKITVTIPPIANAGADRLVYEGTRVLLNGSNSTDSDGRIVSYKWAEGSEIYNTAQSFEKVFPIGVHTITLTVTDNDGSTGSDTVDIEVLKLEKAPPIADAGTDIVVDIDEIVVLNASDSSDRDGSIISYQWLENGAVLSNAISFNTTFSAGKHIITLIVTDDDNLTGNDTIIVTVLAPNVAPVANAGTDFNVPQGDYANLDGTQSSDLDGTIVLYEWKENGKILSTNKSFTIRMGVGVHHIELAVTDNNEAVSTDTVTITVYPPSTQLHLDSDTSETPSLFLFAIISVLFFVTAGVVVSLLKSRNQNNKNQNKDGSNNKTRRPSRSDESFRIQTKSSPTQDTGNGQSKGKDSRNLNGSSIHEGATESKYASASIGEEQEENEKQDLSVQEKPKEMVPTPVVKAVKHPEELVINLTDSTTGLPVANAKISIGSNTYKTDTKGNAKFKELLGNTLEVVVSARLYQNYTQNMTALAMMRLELVPLPLIIPRQEHSISTIKKGFDESYRSIMTYDRCIPSFYRGIVYNHIKMIHGITTGQLSQSEIEPEVVIDALIKNTELVSQGISNAMTSKRIIDIYSASPTSMECTASEIDPTKLNHLIIDPNEYYASSYLTVQRRLSEVDSQITLISRQMSVIPLSNLLKIAKEMLECDVKSQLERAICVFVADTILDHIVEMYNNEHIVSRLKLGVL